MSLLATKIPDAGEVAKVKARRRLRTFKWGTTLGKKSIYPLTGSASRHNQLAGREC